MTYENGEDDSEAYLIGPGFDLAVPGFNFFTLNFYYRQTEGSRPGDDVRRSHRPGPTPCHWAIRAC